MRINMKNKVSLAYIKLIIQNQLFDFQKLIMHEMEKKEMFRNEVSEWLDMDKYLEVLKVMETSYGTHALFNLGKRIGERIRVPAKINSLILAINHLDKILREYHQSDYLIRYRVLYVDYSTKEILVKASSPYPCYFERGIFYAFCKRFKPDEAKLLNVELSNNQPGKSEDKYISYYKIIWL